MWPRVNLVSPISDSFLKKCPLIFYEVFLYVPLRDDDDDYYYDEFDYNDEDGEACGVRGEAIRRLTRQPIHLSSLYPYNHYHIKNGHHTHHNEMMMVYDENASKQEWRPVNDWFLMTRSEHHHNYHNRIWLQILVLSDDNDDDRHENPKNYENHQWLSEWLQMLRHFPQLPPLFILQQ